MSRLLLSLMMGILLVSPAYSQAAAAPADSTDVTVVDPQQFKSNVKDLDKKTQDELRQQVKNSLSAPPLSTPSTLQVTVPEHTTKEDTSTQKTNESAPASTAPVMQTSPPPPPPAPVMNAPAASAPPAQQAPSNYTGFGTQGNTGNGSTTKPASGGGWNIKY